MKIFLTAMVIASFFPELSLGQKIFTHADTLRGSITPERAWWDVQRYDVSVTPDFNLKIIIGENKMTYRVTKDNHETRMQIDLQVPLAIDSAILNNGDHLTYSNEENVWYLKMPDQKKGNTYSVQLFYSGKVHEAIRPPLDGGWIWAKDSLGRPWMTVACQGLGASVWYPCKDHQSDEPDKGASLTMTVPDTLTAVANGRIQFTKNNGDGTATTKWAVVNSISNYCLIPYIGKYVNFSEVYKGETGNLTLNYWVLNYNQAKAKNYMPEQVHKMLTAFEYWFGPYPFYEDGYQLIDASHSGMEHQSAVSYGNGYKFGYRGKDPSGFGWGLKFDFIIIHESGHEWFGNNLTTKDLADMWVHEGFTNYSETLFTEYHFGKKAGNEYNFGIRPGIGNKTTIIPAYNVNAQGSGDMYNKGGNMLHAIRHSMDNDVLFRNILRGLNKDFYHQTVTSKQVEQYISRYAGFNYQKVFNQYLRNLEIPSFEYYFSNDGRTVNYRYQNCIDGFNLPLSLNNEKAKVRIVPSKKWQHKKLKMDEKPLFEKEFIAFNYYIKVKPVNKK
ncbi:M1 family metallopeptidase [Ferruginibacter sp.]|uniref:M1 family metallopeptidase n=1 Tax=Ferruginibacter sp. TaxID=1940288 RepID=UPI0019BF4190|nr:M1 family metallopeptidase [Ferruginibacter sp.]MBC7625975.1 M1 family metallopeptidase [Ferruginibacter sp.]